MLGQPNNCMVIMVHFSFYVKETKWHPTHLWIQGEGLGGFGGWIPQQVLILQETMGKYAIKVIFSPFCSISEQEKSPAAPFYDNYFHNVKKPFNFYLWSKILQHVFGRK